LLSNISALPPFPKDARREELLNLVEVDVDIILEKQRLELERRQEQEQARTKLLLDRGFQPESLLDELQG
jgi:hypothetical protein